MTALRANRAGEVSPVRPGRDSASRVRAIDIIAPYVTSALSSSRGARESAGNWSLFAVHNVIAHPLLVLWPSLGEWLHEATDRFEA